MLTVVPYMRLSICFIFKKIKLKVQGFVNDEARNPRIDFVILNYE